ncbi:MAG: NUDIX domain-containing protein [Dysgonamonadaceae bacterium]|jgi:ADP-ribose pyrophosphatase YjhB (NUDIX family)|nr:NUDIX domain-containing protein [Dysgonamonadaceae bacterium]
MPHPLDIFHFCPLCGSKNFGVNNLKSKECADCGFIYYANPSAAVAAVIENEKDEILVARRAKEPAKGTFDLPGGFSDMDETIEESVRREVKEETSLDVTELSFLFSIPNIYVYSGMEIHTMDLFFRCKVKNFNGLTAKDDVAELVFIPVKQLNPKDFGLTSIRKGIEKLQKILINV